MITSTPLVVGTYMAGALLLIGGLAVVWLPSARAAAVAFVASLLLVAAIAWVLDAPVLALVQVAIAVVAGAGFWLAPTLRSVASGGGRTGFSGLVIPGAVAVAGVLVVMVIAVVKTGWRSLEPGTGTSWREYQLGLGIAVLTMIAAALGTLWPPPGESRHARPAAAPAPPHRSRGRR